MAPGHPYKDFKVQKRNHPGSQQQDIDDEPDWSSCGHDHYVGYKNAQRRRPGYIEEDSAELGINLREARDEFRSTKQRAQEGQLVSWQDAIKSEKVSSEALRVGGVLLSKRHRTFHYTIAKVILGAGDMFWTTRRMVSRISRNGQLISKSEKRRSSSRNSMIRDKKAKPRESRIKMAKTSDRTRRRSRANKVRPNRNPKVERKTGLTLIPRRQVTLIRMRTTGA